MALLDEYIFDEDLVAAVEEAIEDLAELLGE